MRPNIPKKHSTKSERIFIEALKERHVEFLFRIKVENKEVDFIIGDYAIEINGHEQDVKKNEMLASYGYIPIHLHNSEVNEEKIKRLIEQIT